MGCPACSSIADSFNGIETHLAGHDVMLWAVSRAPLAKLQGFRRRMGWSFPWASAFGGDFNPDFNVYFTEQEQREGAIEYNYRREEPVKPKEKFEMKSEATPGGRISGSTGRRRAATKRTSGSDTTDKY